MTTNEAAKLNRDDAVVWASKIGKKFTFWHYIVESVQIRLSDMMVILTTQCGDLVICKAETLETEAQYNARHEPADDDRWGWAGHEDD